MSGLAPWLLAILCGCCFISTSFAEIATATDQDAEELIVAQRIQQAQPTTEPNQVKTTPTPRQVADDLAEGQLQRDVPSLTAPIVDQAKLLSPEQYQQLSARLMQLHQQGIIQVGIIIVPSTGQEDIFGFAMRTADAWQLGTAKRDNGLLMAIAVNDRKIQILTGYGLEGVLPDILVSRIINNDITPYFKQNQYAEGISAGLDEIERIATLDPELAAQQAQELREQQEAAYREQEAMSQALFYAFIILVVGVVISNFVGNRITASTAAVAGVTAGLVSGLGLVMSLVMGLALFILLISSIAHGILSMVSSSGGGGSSGGFGGGGGFSGGGGGFGGGGASGSW